MLEIMYQKLLSQINEICVAGVQQEQATFQLSSCSKCCENAHTQPPLYAIDRRRSASAFVYIYIYIYKIMFPDFIVCCNRIFFTMATTHCNYYHILKIHKEI